MLIGGGLYVVCDARDNGQPDGARAGYATGFG